MQKVKSYFKSVAKSVVEVGKSIARGIPEGFILTIFIIGFIGVIYMLIEASLTLAFILIFVVFSYRIGKNKGGRQDDDERKPGRTSYSR